MNIFNKKPEDEKYAGTLRRGTAATIDVWIVLFIRIVTMQLMGEIWMNRALMNFMQEFNQKFGTETVKDNPEHLSFIINHSIFAQALIFYFITIMVGALYHAYLNSSVWEATIGKRLMKIMITKENDMKITFKRGLLHYFLSLMPFVFLIYLVSYQIRNNLTFYQAITSSEINIFLGILFVMWLQIHIFTKKRTTAYDMICNTNVVKGKTSYKWPWSKN